VSVGQYPACRAPIAPFLTVDLIGYLP